MTDKTYSIELNQQEILVLRNLINIAVMTKGLEAAEAGLHLDGILTKAVMSVEKLNGADNQELELNSEKAN